MSKYISEYILLDKSHEKAHLVWDDKPETLCGRLVQNHFTRHGERVCSDCKYSALKIDYEKLEAENKSLKEALVEIQKANRLKNIRNWR